MPESTCEAPTLEAAGDLGRGLCKGSKGIP